MTPNRTAMPSPPGAPDEAATANVEAVAPAVASARRVLQHEAAGLSALADALGDSYAAAVDLLDRTTGRVVVSGMGKSGHIAGKMVATLASTGTPALFVHPAEASHGDLGMIAKDDVVILLSNSGETPELRDLIAYTRRFDIAMVAICSRADSTLAKAADIALLLPDATEACPMRLAPTTSTTMTLALGDALAVTLLERRGFTPDDFHVFHPGGKLGARLKRVRDIMHRMDELPLVAPHTPMSETLIEMSGRGFGTVGVLDEAGRLIGIVTDGDLRRHMAPDLLGQPVARVMTPDPKSMSPDALLAEATAAMSSARITCLFVVDEAGRPIGLLHLHDCLREGAA